MLVETLELHESPYSAMYATILKFIFCTVLFNTTSPLDGQRRGRSSHETLLEARGRLLLVHCPLYHDLASRWPEKGEELP
jgi:hypothetical protein